MEVSRYQNEIKIKAATDDGKNYANFGELKNGTSNTQLAVVHKDILTQSIILLGRAINEGQSKELGVGMIPNASGGYNVNYNFV